MLNYGESQILEMFKNTLLSHLYLVLFPVYRIQAYIYAMEVPYSEQAITPI